MEVKEGIIVRTDQGGVSGIVRDNFSGNEHPFDNPARVTVSDGSIVVYVEIVTGNDKIVRVVRDVKG